MESLRRKGSVAFALLTTFDGIDPLAAVVLEMHFLLGAASSWKMRKEGDKDTCTTRFQLILPVRSQKPPNFKVVREW